MDNGSNFSFGQKQLICLARAILKNRILVATANTNSATDELIQAIRSVFKHHPHDRASFEHHYGFHANVMDEGEVRDFDTPSPLLADGGSLFSSMVDANGEEQSKILR